MTNDNTLHTARLHWIIFLRPLIFLLLAPVIYWIFPVADKIAWLFAGFALVWLVVSWITWQYSSLAIKPQQIILSQGFIMRETITIPVSKIESVDIRQSIIGTLLHYGTLVITGSGGTHQIMDNIHSPLTCRRYIEDLLAHAELHNG